jgi:preprotein translocase subunit Sec61beta
MSKKDKNYMPQSTAGIMRYYDTSKESIKIEPEHILIACAVFIIIEILIKFLI